MIERFFKNLGGINYLQNRVDNTNDNEWSARNNFNNVQANPFIPQVPQLPFYPFPQFQFPSFPFPNFAPFPNVYNNQPNHAPYPQQPSHPLPPTDNSYPQQPIPQTPTDSSFAASGHHPQTTPQTSTLNRVDNGNQETHFATDSFFSNNDDRQWTEDQEMQWQATTKAPFFENTVPGNEKSFDD